MGAALLSLRLLLACVFVVAGLAKLADLAGSRRAAVEFGVPERLAGVVGVGLPVCELAVAAALLVSVSARFGALVLLGVFVAGVSVALVRGTEADCHCFGQLHSAPVGWRTLARNVLLAAMAGFVVLARHPDGRAHHRRADRLPRRRGRRRRLRADPDTHRTGARACCSEGALAVSQWLDDVR
jgi:uncharacterized membrane protein YphA (DoxX/SURF4 family)